MSSLAGVSSVTLLLPEHTLSRIVLPLVAPAAGSLLAGQRGWRARLAHTLAFTTGLGILLGPTDAFA